MSNALHDQKVDEREKLECQIYVYLKEKEEYFKEIEESKQEHS